MVSSLAFVAFALLPFSLAQKLTVNTPPSIVACQPAQIAWTGGSPPYFLSFIPAGQPSAPAIKQFPSQTGTELTWKADLPVNTAFTISLRDSTGNQAFSDKVSVQSGPDTSCANTSVQESGSAGTAPATGGSAPASATGGAASSGAKATSSAASASDKPAPATSSAAGSAPSASAPSSPSASAASAKPSNAASSAKGNTLAIAGMMGIVGAALF